MRVLRKRFTFTKRLRPSAGAGGSVLWLAAAAGLIALAMLLNTSLLRSTRWVTLVGDPRNPDSDSVQLGRDGGASPDRYRIVHLRINHGSVVTSLTGTRYRSLQGVVRLDCLERRGRYLSADYYGGPTFTGKTVLRRLFDRGEEPPVRLLGFDQRHVSQLAQLGCM